MSEQQIVLTERKAAQLSMFGIFDAQHLGKAFEAREILDKAGNVVGGRMKMRSRKEQAAAYDLKGKDNAAALVEAILTDRDEAMRKMKGYISGLNGDHTLAKFETRVKADGVESIKVEFHKVKRAAKGDSAETIAAKLGLPVEKVLEMIERQSKATAAVDVSATSTQQADQNPATGTQEAPDPIVT